MSDRFDNEESTGFVSNIPQDVVDAMPYGPGMMVKAILQKVWDHLNRDPRLQEEFGHALKLWATYSGKDAEIERLKERLDRWENPGRIKQPPNSP